MTQLEARLQADLDKIFAPRSVAVIGASRRPGSVGRSVFLNVLSNNFAGVIYPINPKADAICGVKSYPNVLDVPDDVDLAVIIVPAEVVPKVAEECGQKGVRGLIVVSAGFREVGGRGAELEKMVADVVKKYGMRLVGPNCLGIINTDTKVSLNASFAATMPKVGNIGFVSQSGALCTAILDYAKGQNVGFSKFVSMGNKADVSENDLLRYLKDDPQTDVILLYIEDLVNGREFMEIAREATEKKPLIAIKAGVTIPGARAATSHTGALAGSEEAYDAIFLQSGVLRVESAAELFDFARAFANQPLPRGNRVAIVTNAGGPGIMATDACVRYGLYLADLDKSTSSLLRSMLPPAASVWNPVDLIGDAQHDRYDTALTAVLKDRNVDSAVVILTPQAMTDIKEIALTISRIAPRFKKPVLACFMGIVDVSVGVKVLEENGIAHYTFPEAAVRALATMCNYAEWIVRPRTEVRTFNVDKEKVRSILEEVQKQGRTYLPQQESISVLGAYGFIVPKTMLAHDEEEAVRAASQIGYPVVMKISSPDIVHKVDLGGVKLDLGNELEIREAYRDILKRVRESAPRATIWGVNIQEMVSGGKETIIGMRRDPRFGPLLMFGLGGIYVEAYRDVSFRLAPIRELSAYHMIKSTRASKILEGFRGEKPSDIKAIVECLQRLSQLAVEFEEIQELDINPLKVFEHGKGCKAVDARIVIRP